jgi:large-conductance mechanosensitive channel
VRTILHPARPRESCAAEPQSSQFPEGPQVARRPVAFRWLASRLGNDDFGGLFLNIGLGGHAMIEEAGAAGAPTLDYGLSIDTVVDFAGVAFCIFMIIGLAMRPAPAPATRERVGPPSVEESP